MVHAKRLALAVLTAPLVVYAIFRIDREETTFATLMPCDQSPAYAEEMNDLLQKVDPQHFFVAG